MTAQPTKPGGIITRIRFGDVPVLAVLAAAVLFGATVPGLDAPGGGEHAPGPAAQAPQAPEPVAKPPAAADAAPPPLAEDPPPALPEPAVGAASAPPAEPPPAPEHAPASPAPPITAETALAGLRDALAEVRCADLRAELVDGVLGVAGTVTSAEDRERVWGLVETLPAELTRPPHIALAAPALCEPLLLLEPLRAANAAQDVVLSVAAPAGDGTLSGGQDLVLDLRASRDGGHVLVDYFTADGGVVHLLPNPLEPAPRLEAGATRRLGGRDGRSRFWTIGPPFGQELIVVVLSGAPLFPTLRPEAEPAAAYLPELKRALAGPGAGEAVAAALFIATRAP